MTAARWARTDVRWTQRRRWLAVLAVALWPSAGEFAYAGDTFPRLFFADANISFTFPNHWDFQSHFPYGPLFSKKTNDGSRAEISCAISAPIDPNRASADLAAPLLKQIAKDQLEAQFPGFKAVDEADRRIAGQNAFEIIWDNVVDRRPRRHQTVYFYVQNRVYAMSLEASPRAYRWLQPDFQNWLNSLRILSRKDSGALADPAHGGLWIHQTGGLKVIFPTSWLIGVSDDRTLGATLAQGAQHAAFTATVSLSSGTMNDFSPEDRRLAARAVHRKGFRLTHQSDEAFHGLPALQLDYEGSTRDRVIRGRDIWVLSPKGRWLFNLEGDVSLYNSLSGQLEYILNTLEFI